MLSILSGSEVKQRSNVGHGVTGRHNRSKLTSFRLGAFSEHATKLLTDTHTDTHTYRQTHRQTYRHTQEIRTLDLDFVSVLVQCRYTVFGQAEMLH